MENRAEGPITFLGYYLHIGWRAPSRTGSAFFLEVMTHLPGFAGVFVRDTPATLWVPSPSRSQEKGNTCQDAREQSRAKELSGKKKGL